MKHHHWCLNGEIIYQFCGFVIGLVRKIAASASTAHSRNIFVHPGPIEPKAHAMKGVVGVEVTANRVGVERNKDNVEEL